MAQQHKTSPQIRFAGFSGDWEERKLEEVVDFFSGLTYSPNAVVDDGTLVLRSSNVKNGEIVDADNVYVKPTVVNSDYVKFGDIIVVVRNGSRDLIGKHAQIKHPMQNTVIGAFMTGVRSDTPEFINALLDTRQFDNEINKNLGATINQITTGAFRKMLFFFPKEFEQQKIGQLFVTIDNLITEHQREHEQTVNIKKAMLEKMFPKAGATTPEIRFAGFSGDWQQKKLGDIARFINGRAYSQNELLSAGKYKVLRVGNFYTNESWYYSDMELGEKYYANTGDLLYTWSASFGPHIWLGGKVIYHYHIWKVELSEVFDKQFAVQVLEYDKAKILSDSNGSTMIHITKNGMEEKFISLPSVEEQQKIGQFFASLDRLLSLQQRRLAKLKSIKLALLENMFV